MLMAPGSNAHVGNRRLHLHRRGIHDRQVSLRDEVPGVDNIEQAVRPHRRVRGVGAAHRRGAKHLHRFRIDRRDDAIADRSKVRVEIRRHNQRATAGHRDGGRLRRHGHSVCNCVADLARPSRDPRRRRVVFAAMMVVSSANTAPVAFPLENTKNRCDRRRLEVDQRDARGVAERNRRATSAHGEAVGVTVLLVPSAICCCVAGLPSWNNVTLFPVEFTTTPIS